MGNKKAIAMLCPGILLLLASLVLTLPLSGQGGRGSVSGTVTDPSGAVVDGAKVTLLNKATGVSQHSTTTARGLYVFVSLNPGAYVVTVTQKGFATIEQDNIPVTVDQVTTVDLSLPIGGTTEVVKVTEAVDLTETSNSTVGQLISSETMDRMPLLNRNVFDMVQLSAGVTPVNGTPNSSQSQTIQSITSGRPGVDVSAYTINGALAGSVYFMVDGSPLGIAEQDISVVMPAMDLPEDGVEETRVETQNTPASYQSGGAGVISIVSKSGSDKFHGDAFGVFRPDALAANEWFNKRAGNPTPDYHRYQEGGAIGGPILHKKLFFFGDYEATQQQQYDGSNVYTVPTAAERTGDFSADSFTIYDPTSADYTAANAPDPSLIGARQPFAGNKIANPDPIALKFLSEFPLPNQPGQSAQNWNNRFDPGTDPLTAQKFDARIDWAKSDKQHLFGRFSFDRLFQGLVNTSQPPSGAFDPTPMWDPNYAQNITNGRNFTLADDLTLNDTTVLQLRYSFTRHYEVQGGNPSQNGYDITKLGFPAALKAQQAHAYTLPLIVLNDTYDDATIQLGGTGNWNNFVFASENQDANAVLTKILGKHELSAGGEFMKRFLNTYQPPDSAGAYGFDITATDQSYLAPTPTGGNAFASFLVGLGFPGEGVGYNGNFSQDLSVAEANPYYALFLEDTYRPFKNLTLVAGVRWDVFGGKTERHNRLEYFDPAATNTVSGVAYTGAEVYVSNGNRSPFTTNYKDFSPRLSFSWQPAKHLVVRAGGGIYYGPSAHMVGAAAHDSDGFASATTWNATCQNSDGNTVLNGSAACNSNAGSGSLIGQPYSLENPFPGGLVPILSHPTGLGNNLGTTLNTVLHSQRTLTTYNYNFGIEYEFPHAVVFSAGYVGSRGLFLPLGEVDLNELDLGTIANDRDSLMNTTVPNTWAAILPQTNGYYGAAQVPLWVSLQPYPQFGSGSYNYNGGTGGQQGVNVHGYPGGDSEYSSLQTKIQKRLTSHFSALASFTWSKLMTDDASTALAFVGSHVGTVQDWRNLNLEHAISPQDVKYQFTWQASYDLPIGRGRALDLGRFGNEAVGGWTIDGIFYLSTGIPIAAPASGTPGLLFGQRADVTCDPGKGAPHTADEWFSYACLAVPASMYQPGTAPAYFDHLRTAGADDVDLTLSKNFALGKERNLRIDISAYNIANRAQMGMPSLPPAVQGGGGVVTNTVNTPRQFQFGARYLF